MNYIIMVVSLLIPMIAGAIGSIANINSIPTWYEAINKPSFNPPNWIFGPVWTILYLLMGVSLYLVWSKGIETEGVKTALLIFGIQLLLNILWSYSFFYFQSPLLGLINILVLIVFIVLNIIYFYKIVPLAGYLLIPYLLWVLFATALNLSIFLLN